MPCVRLYQICPAVFITDAYSGSSRNDKRANKDLMNAEQDDDAIRVPLAEWNKMLRLICGEFECADSSANVADLQYSQPLSLSQ